MEYQVHLISSLFHHSKCSCLCLGIIWPSCINKNKINNDLEVAHPQSGSSPTDSWSNWNLEMLFLGRGENWSTRRKSSRRKGENQQQTQPT